MVLADSISVKWLGQAEATGVPEWVANDPVAQEYAAFFACLYWEEVPERDELGCWSGQHPHPERAYMGALLVMIVEGKVYFTHLRKFLLQHPALVWVLRFRRVPDPRRPWGFDVTRTVPTARHLGRKLRRLAPATLRALLAGTVADLAHYYTPLRQQTNPHLGFHPKHLAADAAYDAWYVYQPFAQQEGLAAVPLNTRGHDQTTFGPSGFPFALCPAQREMRSSYRFHHTHGYEAQRLHCPLLYPTPTDEPCPIQHEQFLKGVGCVKDINVSVGGQMRLTLDRHSEAYHVIYDQRTASERLFSQAKEHGIERPRVRNGQSVCNRNTLIYIVLNVKLLQRIRRAKARAPT